MHAEPNGKLNDVPLDDWQIHSIALTTPLALAYPSQIGTSTRWADPHQRERMGRSLSEASRLRQSWKEMRDRWPWRLAMPSECSKDCPPLSSARWLASQRVCPFGDRRKFSLGRRGHLFSLAGGLTTVQVYRLFAVRVSHIRLACSTFVAK